MRAAPAKFLFDTDFRPGRGDSKPSIALDEHAARLTEAEAAAFTHGFDQGADRGQGGGREALGRHHRTHRDGDRTCSTSSSRRSKRGSKPRPSRSRSRSRKKLAPELIAREPFAEIAALAIDCFRNLVQVPACGGARERRAARDRARQARRDRAPLQPRQAGWWCWPNPRSRSATAASNGPTAASTATAPPSPRRSTRRWRATSMRGEAEQRRRRADAGRQVEVTDER